MFHLAVVITLGCVSALGSIGNLFMLGSVLLHKKLNLRAYAFVVNLAMVDLIISGYLMPFALAKSLSDDNPLTGIVCEVNAFLILTMSMVSALTLMFIALEKYVYICKSKMYPKLFQPKFIGIYILFTWLFTITWTVQGWTGWTTFIYRPDTNICFFHLEDKISYRICWSVVCILIPMVVIAFCYINIFLVVQKSRKTLIRHKKHFQPEKFGSISKQNFDQSTSAKLGCTLFVLILFFLLLCGPSAFVFIASSIWSEMPEELFPVVIWLTLCSSCINCLLYGAMNSNFRNGYKNLFQNVFSCCNGTNIELGSGNKDIDKEKNQEALSNSNSGGSQTRQQLILETKKEGPTSDPPNGHGQLMNNSITTSVNRQSFRGRRKGRNSFIENYDKLLYCTDGRVDMDFFSSPTTSTEELISSNASVFIITEDTGVPMSFVSSVTRL